MFQKHIKHLYFRTPNWVREKLTVLQPRQHLGKVKQRINDRLPRWITKKPRQ